MPTPLDRVITVTDWRRAAVGVLLVVGALASAGGVAGNAAVLVSPSLSSLGVAAAVVLALSTARSVAWRLGHATGEESGPPATAATAPGASTPLELYQSEGCPHCARVRRFCTRHGISVVLHNPRTAGSPLTAGVVTNPERHAELTGHGRDQVPLLVDAAREEALYESDDIVAYLDEHYT